jgi:deoxyadenosine/deoxycytidine kinase
MPRSFDPVFVAIAGNIGSGKSSLTTVLAQRFGWKPYYEIVDTNPYLADFYKDMRRWSFQLQMFFLTKRFNHQQDILKGGDSVIQDRTIFEDAEIFAKNLFLQGRMEERDYRTYTEHFQLMTNYLKVPDLIVYLKADVSTLLTRIALRGRDYEQKIPAEYLTQLNGHYDGFAKSYNKGPLITIDVNRLDFVNNPKHLEQISNEVSWEIEKIRNRAQTRLPLGTAYERYNETESHLPTLSS